MSNNISLISSERLIEPEENDLKSQVLLENKNFNLNTEYLLQTLERCFPMCAIESLDEEIFSKILPRAHRFLSQITEAINNTTANIATIDVNDVRRKLHVCNDLFCFWRKCVEYVSTFKTIQASYIISLCNILPETIMIAYKHCKVSLNTYVTLMDESMQELKDLFGRTSAVSKLFFATLDSVIVFDTDVKLEAELLMKAISTCSDIASITNRMDMTTFVVMSEAFAKLAIAYQNDIKRTSPELAEKSSNYLIQIVKDMSKIMSVIKDQDDKNMTRNIAHVTHLLTITEQLTKFYSTVLVYETLLHLFELSVQIYGFSCFNATMTDGKTISAHIASILDIIFNHDNFRQAYFEYGKRIDTNRFNYHLLTIAFMKKLNDMPYEHLCKWCLGSDSILNIAFTYIEHSQEDVVEELRLPSDYETGDRPRLIGIYESTLVSLCDLISQILPEDFHALELLLLKHLLSGCFWSSLLSSDVWYFIGRLGTSQLCAEHVKYLIQVSIAMTERYDSTEIIILNNMIGRLYELLTEDMKANILMDINVDLDMYHHIPILHSLIAQTKHFSSEHSIYKLKDLPRIFSNLQKQPTTCNWKYLKQFVSMMQKVDYSNNENIINVLIQIWSFVVDVIAVCDIKQLDILSDFVITLLDGTRLGDLRDDALHSVLKFIAVSCIYTPARVNLKICRYLRQNTENLDRCKNMSDLVELFHRLLGSENLWVRQEALQTFEHIGHTCSQVLVSEIARCLAKVPSINNIIFTYLSDKSYHILPSFESVPHYCSYVVKDVQKRYNQHICYKYKCKETDKKMQKLLIECEDSDVELAQTVHSVQLNEQAQILYEGLTKVLEGQAYISEANCRKLIIILEKILKVSKK